MAENPTETTSQPEVSKEAQEQEDVGGDSLEEQLADAPGTPEPKSYEDGESGDRDIMREMFGESDSEDEPKMERIEPAARASAEDEMEDAEQSPAVAELDDLAAEEDLQERPQAESLPKRHVGPEQHIEYVPAPQPPPDAKLRFVKLPNFIAIEPKRYDPEDFEESRDIDPETVIRWRETVDSFGDRKMESNARLVRWSDGSVQLFIGANEVMNVTVQNISKENNFMFLRTSNGLMVSQTKLTERLIMRPATTQSKAHQQLTAAIAEKARARTSKLRKTKILTVQVDPEKEKEERERQEEERIRAATRIETEKRKRMDSYVKRGVLSSAFLEEDEVEEGNVGAIKRQYKAAKKKASEEAERERRILEAKSAPASATKKKAKTERELWEEVEDALAEEAEDGADQEDESSAALEEKKGGDKKRKAYVVSSDED